MDLSFSPEEEAFRAEVRAFIADAKSKLPKNMGAPEAATRTKDDYLAWHKLLYKKGWVAPAWPKEYGGTGWTRDAALHLQRGMRAGRDADDVAFRAQHGRAGDLHLRQ